jgi:hypothetical protein
MVWAHFKNESRKNPNKVLKTKIILKCLKGRPCRIKEQHGKTEYELWKDRGWWRGLAVI